MSPIRDHNSILLVEDDWLVAQDLAERVSELGYAVVGPAPSVKKALALIESERIDGALLDLNLGSETSYAIAEKLEERTIPFVFLTGYTSRELRPRFRKFGTIGKPVSDAVLADALHELLV